MAMNHHIVAGVNHMSIHLSGSEVCHSAETEVYDSEIDLTIDMVLKRSLSMDMKEINHNINTSAA